MYKKIVSKVKDRRWTLKKEIRAQEENLKALPLDDAKCVDTRKKTLDSLKQTVEIRNMKRDSVVKAIKEIGTLALCGVVALIAYQVDKSDEIPRNKNLLGVFGRMFRF